MTQIRKHARSVQDWFGLSIRLGGLVSLFLSVQSLLTYANLRLGLTEIRLYGYDDKPEAYLIHFVGYAVFAMFLIRTAPAIVAFAYPPVEDADESDPGATDT